jgi:TrmH family RNA methyltransferase
MGTLIQSSRHPLVQRLRRLSGRRSARSDEGAFVIDGPTLLDEALDAGVAVEEVLAEPGCPERLLDRAEAAGAEVHRATTGLLARATDTVTPQPVAAIATFDDIDPAGAAGRAGPLALVLVGVGDPGNAGTLLRSVEGAGGGAALFCDGSVDPFGPKCVRASAGSVFRLAVTRSASAVDALAALASGGVATVGTRARDADPYDRADLARPVAIVLGSEAHGVPDVVAVAVDAVVTIPMEGHIESLNVGMAGTILCFESLRQRRHAARAAGARGPGGDPNELDEAPPQAAGCSDP